MTQGATNTVKEKGVCNRLNEYLERPVLYLAFRHHVYERHIVNVSKIYRETCGPEYPLFKKLHDKWNDI